MNRRRPRVAVTGAAGFVGGEVARRLTRGGADVVRIVHRRMTEDPQSIAVDLGVPDAQGTLREALSGCTSVIHAAAHVHVPRESDGERARFHAVNVDGTQRLLAAAEQAGIERFVLVSTIGVHGFVDGQRSEEDDAPAPSSSYGATKWLAEQLVREARMDTRIVRLATVVGRGDRANYARLAAAIRGRRFVVPGDGSARKSLLAIDDAAELLARTALEASLPHRLFHLAHPQPWSVRSICDALAAAVGVAPPPSIPRDVLLTAARTVDAVSAWLGTQTAIESTVEKLARDTMVTTDRAEQCFPGHTYRGFDAVASAYAPTSARWVRS